MLLGDGPRGAMGHISHDFTDVYAALAEASGRRRTVTIPVALPVLRVLSDFETRTERIAREAGVEAAFGRTADRLLVRLTGGSSALLPVVQELDRTLSAPYGIEVEFGVGLTRRSAAVQAVIAAMRESDRLGLNFQVRQGPGVAHTYYRIAVSGPVSDVLQIVDRLGRAAGRPLLATPPGAALG